MKDVDPQLLIRLPRALKARLKVLGKTYQITMSDLVRISIMDLLNRYSNCQCGNIPLKPSKKTMLTIRSKVSGLQNNQKIGNGAKKVR